MSELITSSNDFRLWAFHGALFQFRHLGYLEKGVETWLIKDPYRDSNYRWEPDRFEYRIDPEWDGKPVMTRGVILGTGKETREICRHVKPLRPATSVVKELFEKHNTIHDLLYLPTYYKGEELPIPENIKYAWEHFDFLPKLKD